MECPADVLIFHQDTFFLQGLYAYRIINLARSNKVAGAIIAVSRRGSCIASKTLIDVILPLSKRGLSQVHKLYSNQIFMLLNMFL